RERNRQHRQRNRSEPRRPGNRIGPRGTAVACPTDVGKSVYLVAALGASRRGRCQWPLRIVRGFFM
ncbi:hypothetical protein E4U27_002831, partial [Claviceps purpurea]